MISLADAFKSVTRVAVVAEQTCTHHEAIEEHTYEYTLFKLFEASYHLFVKDVHHEECSVEEE